MEKVFQKAILVICVLYLWPAFMFFAPYYNWKYATTHGFLEWLLFGEVIATAKALGWPYFAFTSPNNSVSHFNAAMDYSDKAVAIINRTSEFRDQQGIRILSQADNDAIISFYKKALDEANQVDIAEMNKQLPGFGDRFRAYFIRGADLFVKSCANSDATQCLNAQVLMDSWWRWHAANSEGLRRK